MSAFRWPAIGIFVVLSAGWSSGRAQSCNCQANLFYLENSIEQDYAGFRDKTEGPASARCSPYGCYKLLRRYLAFFNEPHMGIMLRNAAGYLDSLREMFRDEPRMDINLIGLKAR